jgi:rfaE bifunctional protein kinase chain/domain
MIYIVGDIMLDKYVYGTTDRMSPEAPVPILLKSSDKTIIGGAANVALNIRNLTEDVALFGIVGDDKNGKSLIEGINRKKINLYYVSSKNNPTITKTRYLSSSNQILRVDCEKKFTLNESQSLFDLVSKKAKVDKPEIIIISDYNKQTIHNKLDLKKYIDTEKMIVDSKKTDLRIFKNALIYKSNYLELCNIMNKKIDYSSLENTISFLIKENKFKNMITTLAGDGCYFSSKNENGKLLKTEKVEVGDVTGAGDNFIATLAYLMMKKYDLSQAIEIALSYATESVKHQGNYFKDIMEVKE